MGSKKCNNVLACLNLIFLFVAGILSYIFIHLPQIRIQEELIEIRKKFDTVQKQIQITSEMLNIVNDITPNIQLAEKSHEWKGINDEFLAVYKIKNTGKYNCILENLQMTISTKDPTNEDISKALLTEGEHYTLKEAVGFSTIESGCERDYSKIIILHPENFEKIPNQIYCIANFTFKTIPNIVNTAYIFLDGILTQEEIREASKLNYKIITTVKLNKNS